MRTAKFDFFLNLVCLSTGVFCFVLVTVYVLAELAFNHSFEKGHRIYRVTTVIKSLNSGDVQNMAWTFTPLAYRIQAYPEVEHVTRVVKSDKKIVVREGDKLFNESHIISAEENYFDIFDYSWVEGDPRTALGRPFSIVLTKSFARKYFGTGSEYLDQTLNLDGKDYFVTGVINDLPVNTDMQHDAIISFEHKNIETTYDWCYTFVLFQKNFSVPAFQAKLDAVFDDHVRPTLLKSATDGRYELESLYNVHFGDEKIGDGLKGSRLQLLALEIMAVVVLLLSTLNYVNLTISQLSKRTIEVNIKKVLGASNHVLLLHYVVELLIFVLASLLVAFLLFTILRPEFEQRVGYHLLITNRGFIQVSLLIGLIITGVGAGCFQILTRSVAGRTSSTGRGNIVKTRGRFRLGKVLLTIQLTVSLSLVISGITISKQIELLTQTVPSFDRDNVVVVALPEDEGMYSAMLAFRRALASLHYVISTSFIGDEALPTSREMLWDLYTIEREGEDVSKLCSVIRVDTGYFTLLNISFVAGRNFSSAEKDTAEFLEVIVNKAFVSDIGWKNPIGKKIWYGTLEIEVVGVVEDFNDIGIEESVDPLLIFQLDETPNSLMVKLPTDSPVTVGNLAKIWARNFTTPFEFEFLNSLFERQIRKERLILSTTSYFAALAVVIAFFGLFALVSVDLESKAKQIAIRRVFGAGTVSILQGASRHYIDCFILATTFSFGIVIYFMNNWLMRFPYRTEISFFSFFWPYCAAGLLALLVIMYHVLVSEIRNPTRVLNRE